MRGPVRSTSAPAFLAEQAAIRLEEWGRASRADARLADQARERLDRLMQALEGRPVRTTLCHGDIAVGNIFVDGRSAGLIDFDDLRIDLPAIDVSQALIAAAGFARVGPLPVPGLESRLKRAFFEGYGTAGTINAEFLLAHLRNLAVGLQTLACAAGPVTWSRRSHLLQLRGELRRTLTAVDRRRDKQGPS